MQWNTARSIMTETDEVACAMLKAYRHWISATLHIRGNCMAAAREFVRQQLTDEGETMRDSIAHALFNQAALPE